MSFTLSATMDGIAAYAESSGVTQRAYGWPVPNPTVPCMIVGYPTKLDFDLTFHALGTVGKVEATFPLWFVVGAVVEKASRDALSAIISGTNGIKNLMDGMEGGTFLDTARVMDCRIETVQIAGADFLAAVFDLDIVA